MSLPEVDELPDVDIEVEEEIASGKDLQGAAIEPGSTSDLHSRVFLSSKESDRVAREALRVIESLQKRCYVVMTRFLLEYFNIFVIS